MKKLGVIFPGMGYHTDKPLLYYGKRLLKDMGYEIVEISYGRLPKDRYKAFETADKATASILSSIDWKSYDDIVFISKSIGTVIAGKACKTYHIPARNIFYTPVAETIPFFHKNGIVFHGLSDPLMDSDVLRTSCLKKAMPLYEFYDADHSMETPDLLRNIEYIYDIIVKSRDYLNDNLFYLK